MIIVQMHGEPGSGKSTLARAIAPQIGAVVLDKDVIKASLLRGGAAETTAAPAAYEIYFGLASDIARQRRPLILDNPVFWPIVEERWLALCAEAAVPPLLIECVCPDRDELVRRLATRSALESQPHEPLDLTRHPGSVATRFQPRLTVDTTRPLADIVDEALAYLGAAVPA